MHRRNLLSGLIAAIGGAFAASRAQAATETPGTKKLKVVYHLNDLDKDISPSAIFRITMTESAGPTTSPSHWSFMARR